MSARDLAESLTPPHSTEAEQSVLGALLQDNAAFDRVDPLLQPAMFYAGQHRAIYTAITGLIAANKPADVVTVGDQGHDLAYLQALALSVPSTAHATRYAEIVRERWLERELQRAGCQIADTAAATGLDALAKVDAAMARLSKLSEGQVARESVHIDNAVLAYLDQLQAESEGETKAMSTGLRHLDRILSGGLRPGELMVLGARPKMGKTALVLTLARNMARKHGVLVCSQEMPVSELVARNVAALGRVNLADLRRGRDIPDAVWTGVTDAVEAIKGLQIVLDDQRGLTLMDVRRKTMEAKRRHGIDVVIVDFLQLMTGDGDNRNQELDRIANGLKAMAGEFGVAVILLSQLSREADKRSGPPVMTDLRDCGAIEAAADVIALLFREEAHPMGERGEQWKGHAQIEIIQRNGAPGHISLEFNGAHQRFDDWDRPMPQKMGRRGAASRDLD